MTHYEASWGTKLREKWMAKLKEEDRDSECSVIWSSAGIWRDKKRTEEIGELCAGPSIILLKQHLQRPLKYDKFIWDEKS